MAHSSMSTSRMSDVDSHADNVSTCNPDGLTLFKTRQSATKRVSRPNTSKSILSTGSRVSHASQVSFASEVEQSLVSKVASTMSTELIEKSSSQPEDRSLNPAEPEVRGEGVEESESGEEGDVDTDSEYSEMSNERTQEGVHKQFAQLLSERLCEAALMAGTKDNVTVMIVLFPGCGLTIT